ncbi:MAG TPA: LUD domain-containing protein [Chitinophagaceae bacterium]|nr:LUD domain-containing protein [Chitinophagaceae bacterium]
MKVSSSKENILKKIRQALSHPVPVPFPKSEGNNSVYQPQAGDLEVLFAEEFTRLLGKFAFCVNEADLSKQLQQLFAEKKWDNIYCNEEKLFHIISHSALYQVDKPTLANCDASITSCEYLIARTGTIVLSTAQTGRTVSVYAPVHICIAYSDQLVYDIKDALQLLKEKYNGNIPSSISFATGPSRTADIEKTLVVGVHGPKEVYLFLVDKA